MTVDVLACICRLPGRGFVGEPKATAPHDLPRLHVCDDIRQVELNADQGEHSALALQKMRKESLVPKKEKERAVEVASSNQ